jgi:metal-responsive CopG/Arc/MetJ family transcriptional regulator
MCDNSLTPKTVQRKLTVVVSVSLPPTMVGQLDEMARERYTTRTQVIRDIILSSLDGAQAEAEPHAI